MKQNKRILILSASVGTGHTRAAEAIENTIKERFPFIKTLIVDSYRHASALWGRVAAGGYIQMVKRWPKLYGYLYEAGRKEPKFLAFKNWISQIAAQNFRPLIAEFNPSVIVCTHAFPCGIASVLKDEYNIPVVGVVTDYVVHPYWIYNNIDLYSVATMEMQMVLEAYNIPRSRIKVTGIPVDTRFNIEEHKDELRKRHSLELSLPTVLLMGGGLGLGPMEKIFRALRRISYPAQAIVVAGTNKILQRRMETYAKRVDITGVLSRLLKCNFLRNVRVYNYVDFIHELMRASDFVITKPGGLTSTEAIVAETPLLLMKPLPGQEERNYQWLVQKNVAIPVNKEKHIPRVLDDLLFNPKKIERIKFKARQIKKPQAALHVTQAIISLLNIYEDAVNMA